MAKKENQAYKQAPWRIQLQRSGQILLSLVIIALVSGVYLNVSARTATVAIETENLNRRRETLIRQNATLRTEIGILTSATVMRKRAEDLGFIQTSPETSKYLLVEGYSGRQTEISAPPITQVDLPESILKPIYTQSLWEWFFDGMIELRNNQSGIFEK